MESCITITPSEFAALPQEGKDAIQRKQRECLQAKALAGTKLTSAESDFIERQDSKTFFGTPPAQTGIGQLFAENVKQDLAVKTDGLNKTLVIIAVIVVAWAVIQLAGIAKTLKG